MENILEVMRKVFPVMGWLAKVMARNEQVTGFIAGFFSVTCSGPVPDAQRIPWGVPLRGSHPEQISVNLGDLVISVVPLMRLRQAFAGRVCEEVADVADAAKEIAAASCRGFGDTVCMCGHETRSGR